MVHCPNGVLRTLFVGRSQGADKGDRSFQRCLLHRDTRQIRSYGWTLMIVYWPGRSLKFRMPFWRRTFHFIGDARKYRRSLQIGSSCIRARVRNYEGDTLEQWPPGLHPRVIRHDIVPVTHNCPESLVINCNELPCTEATLRPRKTEILRLFPRVTPLDRMILLRERSIRPCPLLPVYFFAHRFVLLYLE